MKCKSCGKDEYSFVTICKKKMCERCARNLIKDNKMLREKIADKVELENLYESQQMILEDISFKLFKIQEKIEKAKEGFQSIMNIAQDERLKNLAELYLKDL